MKQVLLTLKNCSFLVLIMGMFVSSPAFAERIKDITDIKGVRNNHLVGYGLVVGLDGTGDSETFTKQSFRTMLNSLGITIPAGESLNIKNVAAVALHADLPPFSRHGQEIDVTVSSLGNAKSLRGGTLLMAPLKGADGLIYAVAQGNVIVGGLAAEGLDGSKITVNVPVVGRIPNGAIVEREVPNPFGLEDTLTFMLHTPDFTTAQRLSDVVNQFMGKGAAYPLDATSVVVHTPNNVADKVALVSKLENLNVRPASGRAKIVVNSRTGTIVVGNNVTVGPAAVSHGNLSVTITEDPDVSQPEPLSDGTTVVTPDSQVTVTQDNSRMFLVNEAVSLNDIVTAVNQIGASPSDLMAILEALKQVGALKGDIEVI